MKSLFELLYVGDKKQQVSIIKDEEQGCYKIINVEVCDLINKKLSLNYNLCIPLRYGVNIINEETNTIDLMFINDRVFVYTRETKSDSCCLLGVLENDFPNIVSRAFGESNVVEILKKGSYIVDLKKNCVFVFNPNNKSEGLVFNVNKIIADKREMDEGKARFIDVIDKLIPRNYIPIAALMSCLKPEIQQKSRCYEEISDAVMSNHANLFDGEDNNYFFRFIEKAKFIRANTTKNKSVRQHLIEYAYSRLAKAEYDYLICKATQNNKLCYGVLNGYGIAIEALLRVLLIREITQDEFNGLKTTKVNNVQELYDELKNAGINQDDKKKDKNPIVFFQMIDDVNNKKFEYKNTDATLGSFEYFNGPKGWSKVNKCKINYTYKHEIKSIFAKRLPNYLLKDLKSICNYRNKDSHPNPNYLETVEHMRRLVFGVRVNSEEEVLKKLRDNGEDAYSKNERDKGFLWNILKVNWDEVIKLI